VSAEKPGAWPLTHEEFEAWVATSPWQDAVTAVMNPHQYTLKRRSPDPRTFEMAVLHIREFGSQEYFGGREYSYYEAAGHKYWTMMNPLEWTILVNRKPLAPDLPSETEKEQPNMSETLPEVYTARYLATDVLSSGAVIPVRISMYPPEPLLGAALPYQVGHTVRELIPQRHQHGDWRKFSPLFWNHLDETGPEKIAFRLAAIAAQDAERKPLCLLCFEDLQRGQLCHRVIVSAWWREHTGQGIYELSNEGEVLTLEQLHHQVMPLRPK
jgi:hypothetical protein